MDAIEPAPDVAAAGTSEDFCRILRLHQGRVRAYLRRYVLEADLADDLAQETFLVAYRSFPHRNPAAPLDLWLLGIARHRALTHLRDEARRRSHEARGLKAALAAWCVERIGAETDPAERDREVFALRQCLSQLPRHSAGLISAYYFERLTSAEIARKWGKKESAVRMTLLRLREALRHCVENRTVSPEVGP
ncbi:MAG TPA: sigma-70 family RNA polymerase sigma factor [Planctomycetota bacterium]|jgi:RNA polymerase sigma-70 factor (ECF subfamily)|nr:sigma-70 family RNA polymerase sigma factor [Planctomycetota bacterium]